MKKDLEKSKIKTYSKQSRKHIKSKQPVEDIQNRIRNKLSPVKVVAELIEDICKNENKRDALIEYLKNAKLSDILYKNIDWFIKMGATLDSYINDPTFDIEQEISKYKFEKIK